jgi:glutamate-ammonia-ligase adenylyltransferase
MGYASDLELLFVYEEQGRTLGKNPITNGEFFEHLVEELLRVIEARQHGIFEIDLRLRPFGSAGGLASSLSAIRQYYTGGGEADPFERQALIKLRRIAGDEALGRLVESHRDGFVYSGEPWDLKYSVHIRARQIRELVSPGTVNVKYSPGGLIDIEYAAQYLQIMHGGSHPALRTPSTLAALAQLCRLGILPADDHKQLEQAYLFLRRLLDGLRMVRGYSRDLVLPDERSDEFKFLARRLGYHDVSWAESSSHLAADVGRHREMVNRFFLSRFTPDDEDAAAFALTSRNAP